MSTVQPFETIGDFPFIVPDRTTAQLDLMESTCGISRVKGLTKQQALDIFWLKETVSLTVRAAASPDNYFGLPVYVDQTSTFTASMPAPPLRVARIVSPGLTAAQNFWGFQFRSYDETGAPTNDAPDYTGTDGQREWRFSFTTAGYALQSIQYYDTAAGDVPVFHNTDDDTFEIFFSLQVYVFLYIWSDSLGYWENYYIGGGRTDDYWSNGGPSNTYPVLTVPIHGQDQYMQMGGGGYDSLGRFTGCDITVAAPETSYTISP